MEQLARNKGRANLLCNGPRFKHYKPNGLYTMGCNFPPVPVDCSSVIDRNVIHEWVKHPNYMKDCDHFIFGRATLETFKEYRKFFSEHKIHIVGTHTVLRSYYSSGHWGAYGLMKLGYTEIDIYGCDTMFTQNIESYTDKFVEKGKSLINPKFTGEWRKSWDRIAQEEGKGVIFNFIDEIKEDGTVIKKTIHYDKKHRPDP
jgi:hypothetical protein